MKDEQKKELRFFRRGQDFDWLANTAPAPIAFKMGGSQFNVDSSEHVFQAMKFIAASATSGDVSTRDASFAHAQTILSTQEVGGKIQGMGQKRIEGITGEDIEKVWDRKVNSEEMQAGTLAARLGAIYVTEHPSLGVGTKHEGGPTVKEMVMCNVLLMKYTQNPSMLKSALEEYEKGSKFVESTGDRKDTKQVDTFWGDGKRNKKDPEGRNALGTAHMVVLEYLKQELAQNGKVQVVDTMDPSIADIVGGRTKDMLEVGLRDEKGQANTNAIPLKPSTQTVSQATIDGATPMKKSTDKTRKGPGEFTNDLKTVRENRTLAMVKESTTRREPDVSAEAEYEDLLASHKDKPLPIRPVRESQQEPQAQTPAVAPLTQTVAQVANEDTKEATKSRSAKARDLLKSKFTRSKPAPEEQKEQTAEEKLQAFRDQQGARGGDRYASELANLDDASYAKQYNENLMAMGEGFIPSPTTLKLMFEVRPLDASQITPFGQNVIDTDTGKEIKDGTINYEGVLNVVEDAKGRGVISQDALNKFTTAIGPSLVAQRSAVTVETERKDPLDMANLAPAGSPEPAVELNRGKPLPTPRPRAASEPTATTDDLGVDALRAAAEARRNSAPEAVQAQEVELNRGRPLPTPPARSRAATTFSDLEMTSYKDPEDVEVVAPREMHPTLQKSLTELDELQASLDAPDWKRTTPSPTPSVGAAVQMASPQQTAQLVQPTQPRERAESIHIGPDAGMEPTEPTATQRQRADTMQTMDIDATALAGMEQSRERSGSFVEVDTAKPTASTQQQQYVQSSEAVEQKAAEQKDPVAPTQPASTQKVSEVAPEPAPVQVRATEYDIRALRNVAQNSFRADDESIKLVKAVFAKPAIFESLSTDFKNELKVGFENIGQVLRGDERNNFDKIRTQLYTEAMKDVAEKGTQASKENISVVQTMFKENELPMQYLMQETSKQNLDNISSVLETTGRGRENFASISSQRNAVLNAEPAVTQEKPVEQKEQPVQAPVVAGERKFVRETMTPAQQLLSDIASGQKKKVSKEDVRAALLDDSVKNTQSMFGRSLEGQEEKGLKKIEKAIGKGAELEVAQSFDKLAQSIEEGTKVGKKLLHKAEKKAIKEGKSIEAVVSAEVVSASVITTPEPSISVSEDLFKDFTFVNEAALKADEEKAKTQPATEPTATQRPRADTMQTIDIDATALAGMEQSRERSGSFVEVDTAQPTTSTQQQQYVQLSAAVDQQPPEQKTAKNQEIENILKMTQSSSYVGKSVQNKASEMLTGQTTTDKQPEKPKGVFAKLWDGLKNAFSRDSKTTEQKKPETKTTGFSTSAAPQDLVAANKRGHEDMDPEQQKRFALLRESQGNPNKPVLGSATSKATGGVQQTPAQVE